ncbi:MAG: adenylyl-sulfate kinase [Betaproteobacteria bacterium]|nr:adenylyl-sulfate kinase [Betaproteobacteria bacterium]
MPDAFAVWLTGRPASGKSTIARELVGQLHAREIPVALLESDVLRTQITPFARYDPAERDFFYKTVAALGIFITKHGKAVVFDATANRRAYRDRARLRIARFVEVLVDCPLEVCETRDPKGLYRRARQGASATLPGVQIDYDAPLEPELTLRGDIGSPRDAAARIIALLDQRNWLPG